MQSDGISYSQSQRRQYNFFLSKSVSFFLKCDEIDTTIMHSVNQTHRQNSKKQSTNKPRNQNNWKFLKNEKTRKIRLESLNKILFNIY